MNCQENTPHEMSKFCLTQWENGFTNGTEECFPSYITDTVAVLTGIWCIFNAIIGFTGNLLTLLAIPFAANRKRYNHLILIGIFNPWVWLFNCWEAFLFLLLRFFS